MLAFPGIDPRKVAWNILKDVFVYAVQCGMANEKVTLEGIAEVAIESAISSVLGDSQGIIFSVVVSGLKGGYLEYQESGDMARAMGAGFYDAIMTLLEPKTYNAYVKMKLLRMHWVLLQTFSVSITELSQKRCFGWSVWKTQETGK